jgi:hypothetical protein
VRLRKPVAYHESSEQKETVVAKYVLLGDRNVAFKLGNYDPSRRLVIDPILSYSTYLGGSNIDGANAIAVAADNTAFITGGTYSIDFPDAHPLQPNHGGPDDFFRDAFVTKLSADGSQILYSTYLGGKREDVGNGIAVDALGQAYVTGTTDSFDFPVPVTLPTFNPECGGDGQCGATWNPNHLVVRNGFVIKLNVEGTAPLYSGFIGFYENVTAQSIAVDANQIAYVTGQVGPNITPTVPIVPPAVPPPPFPITPNAAQLAYAGGATDAYLAKITATGNSIEYLTYLGGSDEETGFGVAADASANAYVTGISYSNNFPVTAGALQSANAGAGDAFLVKVNTAGGPLLYSTLLGGSGLDEGNGIAVDTTGNAFITGVTSSAGFTSLRPFGGSSDAFVAKFNPSLSGAASLVYFTYLGGSLADAGQSIAIFTDPVSGAGHPCFAIPCAYVTGSTVSADFPITPAVFQSKFGGGNADGFVAKLDPLGSTLLYSTYLGGTNTDIGYGLAVDAIGNAYVAGQTCSLDFPLANPVQSTPGGNCDAFVSKVTILSGIQLNPAGLVFPAQSLGTSSQPQTVTLTNGDNATTISSIALTGANVGDFSETNTCAASLAPGDRCTITVGFTPVAAGIRKAAVIIADNATGSPHVINLSGQSSTLTLSASNLFFGNEPVGLNSPQQPITATNNGTTALSFSSITASGDYTETDNCTKAPLQPTTTCVINVTFSPTTAGSSIGGLTLMDNAPGSPQEILLTGTGVLQPPFQVASLTGTPSVPAGKSATYGLSVTSASGFNQAVALSCSAPATLTCSITPAVVTPTSTQSVVAALTVSSALRTSAPPNFGLKLNPPAFLRPFGGTALLWMLAALLALTAASVRRRPLTATLGFAVVLLLASVACGGSASGVPAGTPVGTYQVTVTGTSGSVNQSIPVTLHVN